MGHILVPLQDIDLTKGDVMYRDLEPNSQVVSFMLLYDIKDTLQYLCRWKIYRNGIHFLHLIRYGIWH